MWSVFAEDNWTPADPLTLTLGIRYDDHNMFGGHLSPRAYAVYGLGPAWTLKGGISTGYKTPKTTDLFDGVTGFGGQGTLPWTGNPDLKPETSVNGEIALYWTSTGSDHNFNITLFRNDFKDKISSTTVTRTCEQTGGVRPCANLGAFHEVLGVGSFSQPINIDEARVKTALMNAARRTVVLADHSKFGREDFANVAPLSQVDTVITDSSIDNEHLLEIEMSGPDVVVA